MEAGDLSHEKYCCPIPSDALKKAIRVVGRERALWLVEENPLAVINGRDIHG